MEDGDDASRSEEVAEARCEASLQSSSFLSVPASCISASNMVASVRVVVGGTRGGGRSQGGPLHAFELRPDRVLF